MKRELCILFGAEGVAVFSSCYHITLLELLIIDNLISQIDKLLSLMACWLIYLLLPSQHKLQFFWYIFCCMLLVSIGLTLT
jgi:hypothetical protein